jgi:hypothetical protein
LLDEIDVFDAIELSHFYTRTVDFNRKAISLAREVGLPLVGNSDSHLARQFETTYSLIECEPTVACVLSAIRNGHVRVVSHPLKLGEMIRIGTELALRDVWRGTKAAVRSRVPARDPLRGLLRTR